MQAHAVMLLPMEIKSKDRMITGSVKLPDNGIGMDRDGVIDQFLTVGFKRRELLGDASLFEPTTSAGHRNKNRVSEIEFSS